MQGLNMKYPLFCIALFSYQCTFVKAIRDPFMFNSPQANTIFRSSNTINNDSACTEKKESQGIAVGSWLGEWQVSEITKSMIILKNAQGQIHTISINM